MSAIKRHPMMAAYVLGGIWLVITMLHVWTEWNVFVMDQQSDGTHAVFWSGDFWYTFARATFENWQSEAAQVFVAAWVFKHFLWHGAPESKSESDRVEEKIDRILHETTGHEVDE